MKRISTIMIASLLVMGTTAVAQSDPVPGKNGNKYVPYEERTGNESIVYFTRNLSAEGLIEAYEQVSADIKGHTGVKLHTGERNGPNIIRGNGLKPCSGKICLMPTSLKPIPITRATVIPPNNIVGHWK